MPKCIAKNCKSASTKKIKMCSFPQEREMQMLWIRNIGRSNWQPKKDSRLCEFHFADDQWETMRVDGRKKLKWKAIPTLFGEDTQIRIDIIKKKCQQELSIKEKNLSTSVNQGNTNTNEMLESPIDTTKISEQNNSMEQEDENIQTEIETEIESTQPLTLSNSKTIPEFEKKLEKLEKHLFQSKKSKKEMMKQLWDMKIKLKRLQQEVRTMIDIKMLNKLFNEDQIKVLTNAYKKMPRWCNNTLIKAYRLKFACGSHRK
ncbi:THAP domain-containing protein 3 isoform X3 [Harpegnathos saltator]|uniref:THAP domain-containing protein 3 isoform X3 n=1 Tax=Harpegnathos saltator TaxID=610380 RepID=UPI000DBEE82D|nr:THAP domain-containing protein 3 isoform X3 [Harpegnathos saltator]